MSTFDVVQNPYQHLQVNEVQASSGYIRIQSWTTPAAASATAVLAATSSNTKITTGITNPVVPRVLSITGAGSTHTASGNVVISGTDIHGNAVTDTIALNSNTTVNGVVAFATVTQVDLTGTSGMGANSTVEVGTSALLGLDRRMSAKMVLGYYVDGALDSAPTVAFSNTTVSQNTISFSTAPNGTHNFKVAFISNQFTNSSGTTS